MINFVEKHSVLKEISVEELKEGLEQNRYVLIDVREPFEFNSYNIGGKLLPLGKLLNDEFDLSEYKGKSIAVLCKAGIRSETAQYYFIQNGIKDVVNIKGGILAWFRIFGQE